ncbi:MAG: hypothetical protein ABI791_01225 [Acidobacteriota bacterium]
MVQQPDIDIVVGKFTQNTKPIDRYTSFDYCFNYFRPSNDLTKDIEKSCLELGFYLASWGMYRGSSALLQKSVKCFSPLIEYLSALDESDWDIDLNNYSDKNIQRIITIYKEVKRILIKKGNADVTLVTKILLGVFGFVPAFDSYFTSTFREIYGEQCGFRRVNTESLTLIKTFYESNRSTIDDLSQRTFTTDFIEETKTTINYPRAKIVDMYGFTRAFKKRESVIVQS